MTDDLIGRAEAQTAIQFAAKRYTVAHEAHGEGQVVWSDNLINVTDAMNVLRDLPPVQPDIIRCKDCKHWNPQLKTANGNGLGSCDFHNVALVTSEGFCYWAERGEQNDSEAD